MMASRSRYVARQRKDAARRVNDRLSRAVALALMACGALHARDAFAATVYWDRNGNGGGAGTEGTAPGNWSNVDNNWTSNSNGTTVTTNWVSGDIAVFA